MTTFDNNDSCNNINNIDSTTNSVGDDSYRRKQVRLDLANDRHEMFEDEFEDNHDLLSSNIRNKYNTSSGPLNYNRSISNNNINLGDHIGRVPSINVDNSVRKPVLLDLPPGYALDYDENSNNNHRNPVAKIDNNFDGSNNDYPDEDNETISLLRNEISELNNSVDEDRKAMQEEMNRWQSLLRNVLLEVATLKERMSSPPENSHCTPSNSQTHQRTHNRNNINATITTSEEDLAALMGSMPTSPLSQGEVVAESGERRSINMTDSEDKPVNTDRSQTLEMSMDMAAINPPRKKESKPEKSSLKTTNAERYPYHFSSKEDDEDQSDSRNSGPDRSVTFADEYDNGNLSTDYEDEEDEMDLSDIFLSEVCQTLERNKNRNEVSFFDGGFSTYLAKPETKPKPLPKQTPESPEEDSDNKGLDDRRNRWRQNRLQNDISEESKKNLMEHRDKNDFPQDVFSFLMVADYNSGREGERWAYFTVPTFIAWFVFGFQMTTYVLIFMSIYTADPQNPFGFPPNVKISTRIAELVAILITVTTQEDLRTGLRLWFDGYHDCKFVTENGNVTLYNWRLSVYSRSCEGFFGPLVTFLLIMGSEDVVDLLLNFSAIEFVSMLDDTAYNLASQGFLGMKAKLVANEVDEAFYYPKESSESSRLRRKSMVAQELSYKTKQSFRGACFLMFVLIPPIVAWIMILISQLSGYFSCRTIYVQFDDAVIPNLGYLSGRYNYDRAKLTQDIMYELDIKQTKIDSMNTYLSRGKRYDAFETFGLDRVDAVPKFQFCPEEDAWTFRYGTHSEPMSEDPCENWMAISSKGGSPYNVLSVSGDDWYVKNKDGREIIVPGFRIFCADCSNTEYEQNFCGDNGICLPHNNEEDAHQCVCKDGWYGSQCGFREPCGEVAVDSVYDPFKGVRDGWSSTYSRLQAGETEDGHYVDLYDRPIYYSETKRSEFELIIFTGRRWILTTSNSFLDIKNNNSNQTVLFSKNDLIRYLEDEFHPLWSNYTISFTSEAVEMDTETDLTPSPTHLEWFNTDYEDDRAINTILLCAECNIDSNPCQSNGYCGSDGRCDCTDSHASGALCHILPVSDGFCDVFFNNERYGYDGGDCCHATCVSDTYSCGQDKESGIYVGYCDCADPTYNTCPDGEIVCWLRNSDSIAISTKKARSGTVIALSANARILAVGEPGLDQVKVYRNDGSEWLQLGETLHGDKYSHFGASVSISGDGSILVVGAPEFQVQPHLALTNEYGHYQGKIHIFQLQTDFWRIIDESPVDEHIYRNVTQGRIGSSFALTRDGGILYISLPYASKEGTVLAFQRNETTGHYFESSDPPFLILLGESSSSFDDIATPTKLGQSLSISNAGHIVALGGRNSLGKDFVLVHRYEIDLLDSTGINGKASLQPIGSRIQGCCGIISGDGHVLVVSTPEDRGSGYSKVYYWNKKSLDWSRRGKTLNGTAIALSSDGLTVAVSFETKDDDPNDISFIQTYFWDEYEWQSQGKVPASEEASVFFSDGTKSGIDTIMAVGLPFQSDEAHRSGQISIYRLRHTEIDFPQQCKSVHSLVRIELTLDSMSNETIWELRDSFSKKILMRDGPFGLDDQYTTKIYQTHLPADVLCGEFTIFDTGGDGLCCNNGLGGFSLFHGDDLVASGGAGGWSIRKRFGDCELTCNDDQSLFRFEITTDNNPQETSWELKDGKNGELYMSGKYGSDDFRKEFVEEACLPSTLCANFTMYDSSGDGICCDHGFGTFSLSWNGKRIGNGGEFANSKSFFFGSNDRCSSDRKDNDIITILNQDIANATLNSVGPNVVLESKKEASITAKIRGECDEGFQNLVIKIRTDKYPSQTRWVVNSFPGFDENWDYIKGRPILEGGPYSNENTAFSDQICIKECILFQIFDAGGNGLSSLGGYTLFLDGKIVASGNRFGSEKYHLIGDNCHIAVSSLRLDRDNEVMCTEDLRNSCWAPAECARDGINVKPAIWKNIERGGARVGAFDLFDGTWTTSGAYSMGFESDHCYAECSGYCYPSSSCHKNERVLHLLVGASFNKLEMTYTLETSNENKDMVLLEGYFDKSSGYYLLGRACIDVELNSCATLTLNVTAGVADYVVLLDDKQIAADAETKTTTILVVGDNNANCLSSPGLIPSQYIPEPEYSLKCNSKIEMLFRLELTLDLFPEEISWYLTVDDSDALVSGGPYMDIFSTVSKEVCVDRERCATFTIMDDVGDGFSQNVVYSVGYVIFVDGKKIASGGKFDGTKSVTFGNCAAQITRHSSSMTMKQDFKNVTASGAEAGAEFSVNNTGG